MSTDRVWTDDSSTELGLNHSSTAAPLLGPRRASGGIDAYLAPQEETSRRVLRERIDKLAREHQKRGIRPTEARRLAAEEIANPEKTTEMRDHEGARIRAIENLADMRKKPPGHSSSGASSKFKRRKTGTRLCPNCHLEGCQCGAPIGRPFKGGRSVDVSCKVSPGADETLEEWGKALSAGAIVEAVVIMAREQGLGPVETLALLDSLRPAAAA